MVLNSMLIVQISEYIKSMPVQYKTIMGGSAKSQKACRLTKSETKFAKKSATYCD